MALITMKQLNSFVIFGKIIIMESSHATYINSINRNSVNNGLDISDKPFLY